MDLPAPISVCAMPPGGCSLQLEMVSTGPQDGHVDNVNTKS